MRNLAAIVGELEGFSEIGSNAQVKAALREILSHPKLAASAFGEAVRAIGMSERPKLWRERVEAAYARMPPGQRREARNQMLVFYSAISDSKAAAPFTKKSDLKVPADVMFAMDALLDQGALKEARQLARRVEREGAAGLNDFDTACLIEALAAYYARVRNWARALELRSLLRPGQVGVPNAAAGISELHLACALDSIQRELARIAQLKAASTTDKSLALSLPGVEQELYKSTEKELSRINRGIERVLPKHRRTALGF